MAQEHVQHKHPLLGVYRTWTGSFLQPHAVWWFCVYGDFYSPVLYGDYAGFAFLALLDPMRHPARVGSFLTVCVLMVRKTIVIERPLLTTLCGWRGSTPSRLHCSASLFQRVYPITPDTNPSQLELT